MSDNLDKDLELELYKQLKQEANTYIKEIPGIWLQKFALIGAVIIFSIAKKEGSSEYEYIKVLGFIAIPFLAVLLDAKVLEFSLHARIISKYIGKTFKETKAVSNWEDLFWGREGDSQEIFLANLRSLVTVAVQCVPTCILIILSAAILGQVTYGIVTGIFYFILTVIMWRLIFLKR